MKINSFKKKIRFFVYFDLSLSKLRNRWHIPTALSLEDIMKNSKNANTQVCRYFKSSLKGLIFQWLSRFPFYRLFTRMQVWLVLKCSAVVHVLVKSSLQSNLTGNCATLECRFNNGSASYLILLQEAELDIQVGTKKSEKMVITSSRIVMFSNKWNLASNQINLFLKSTGSQKDIGSYILEFIN